MGIFDKFKKTEISISLEHLKNEQYEQKYFEACKIIWKNYVPKSGQSTVLQGELLRELEKLRLEAQDNGNINWDSDFSYFCGFIAETLCNQTIYTDDEKAKIKLILSYLQECGNYAARYNKGHIQHAAPIPFENNSEIKR